MCDRKTLRIEHFLSPIFLSTLIEQKQDMSLAAQQATFRRTSEVATISRAQRKEDGFGKMDRHQGEREESPRN
jgi:hypothetical protein